MRVKPFYRDILIYGFSLGLLFCILEWSKYKFLLIDHSTEIYILIIAIIFTLTGIWAGLKLSAPSIIEKKVIVEIPASEGSRLLAPEKVLQLYSISSREYDVLKCIERGLTNDEIASELFVSPNTVKTHISNIYAKLDVKNRTKALDKARAVGL